MKISKYGSWPIAAALLLLAICFDTRADAQTPSHVLWQIGQADRDDKEFALAPDRWAQFGADALYVVGQSKPGVDWPYVQPGPADSWAGQRQHTSSIFFSLSSVSGQGDCVLTLVLVDTQHPQPPRLSITVNGQAWMRDTVSGGSDDSLNGHPDQGKPSVVAISFPSSLLHAGTNRINITTVQGSWLVYDAVTLSAPAGDMIGSVSSVLHLGSAGWLHDVLMRKNGQLRQVLSLDVLNSGAPIDAVLHVSGEPDRTVTVPSGRSTLEEDFPESKQSSRSEVQLTVPGQTADTAATSDRQPCRHYTIYCLEQSHMDIGYAYLQPKALALHQQYLEDGLRWNAQAANLPSDDRFRWNIESLFEVDDWLKTASPAQIAQFQKEARTGNLGLSALYCNELTGICRPEELVALLACANRLRHQYGVPIDSAMITDVPGYTWGIVPVLAQSGVKYFSFGPNGGDHTGFARDFDNKAFYWMSPSGKEKVLVWQSPNAYYPDFDANSRSLSTFLTDFDRIFPNAPYDMICDRHTLRNADNGPADKALAPFVHDWNNRYAYPHLVISTTSRMFHDFEARYGKTLPTVRGDFTGYWEDGAASTANETAINRNASEALAQDDILWSLLRPGQYPHARFEDAWKHTVLYDEHTWGADESWSSPESDFTKKQWAFKKHYALDARRLAKSLQSDALKPITVPGHSDTIAVFNTCFWPRTDLVILPAALSRTGDRVRTKQGKAVPSQRLSDGTLAFLAQNVPALSSRSFTISAGKSRYVGGALAIGSMLKTQTISLGIDPQTGAILHWKVHGITQDLVNTDDKTCRGLNDYLYVLGSDNSKVQYASAAKLTVVDAGPLVASIRVDSAAPGTNSLSRLVQVIDGLDQVKITDTLDKTQEHAEEAVQLGFSFNIPGSTVHLDMPWSVVRPDLDQTLNANKNVYPVDRWADVSSSTFGVTCANLDAPMLEIGEITSPRESGSAWLRTAKTGSTLYWNVMNNYWHTNYKAYQPGPATFRYTLRAHGPYDQAAAQRFGIGQSQPLLFTAVKAGQPDASLPFMLSNPSIQLTACHPSSDGHGWMVRLFNGSSQSQPMNLRWPGSKHLRLSQTDLWGNDGKPIILPMSLAPMQIITLRVVPF